MHRRSSTSRLHSLADTSKQAKGSACVEKLARRERRLCKVQACSEHKAEDSCPFAHEDPDEELLLEA